MGKQLDLKDLYGITVSGIPENEDLRNPSAELKAFVSGAKETGEGSYTYGNPAPSELATAARQSLSQQQTPEVVEEPVPVEEPKTTAKGSVHSFVRKLAPTLVATAFGGLPAAALERLTYHFTPIIADFLNDKLKLEGTKWEQMNSQQSYDFIHDKLGLERADTKIEEVSGQVGAMGAEVMGSLGNGAIMQKLSSLIPGATALTGTNAAYAPITDPRNISQMLDAGGKTLMARPEQQLTGALGGVVTGEGLEKAAEVLGASEDTQAIVNLTGNILGDMLFSNIPTLFSGSKANRLKHVQELMDEFGVTKSMFGKTDDASSIVMADYLQTRGKRISEEVAAKTNIIDRFSSPDVPVPTPKTNEFIDTTIARLERENTPGTEALHKILLDWQTRLSDVQNVAVDAIGALPPQDKSFRTAEAWRKTLGEGFKDASGNIITDTEGVSNKLYLAMRDDMSDFISTNGTRADLNQWQVSNKSLSNMAKEFKVANLEALIKKGNMNFDDVKVEDITRMLTSTDQSDVRKVYTRLSPEGQAVAKTALISKIADEASTAEGLDPTQFANKVFKYARNLQIVFDQDDQKRINGLMKYLVHTRGVAEGATTGKEAVQSYAINKINPVAGFFTYAGRALNLNNFAKTYGTPQIQYLLEELAGVDAGTTNFAELVKRVNRVVTNQQTTGEPEAQDTEVDAISGAHFSNMK